MGCASFSGLEAGLVETVQWGQPYYMEGDRNIVILGALRGDFRLGFFNAALMTDPERVLERAGPNTPYPDIIRFADSERVAELTPVIQSCLNEAVGYARAGTRPARAQRRTAAAR